MLLNIKVDNIVYFMKVFVKCIIFEIVMSQASKTIRLHQSYLSGLEHQYIAEVLFRHQLSGNGYYTKLLDNFFERSFHFAFTLMTGSCTDALEMCALLLDKKEGNEVIVPSYTFVSTALAFVREGFRVVFADCRDDVPCLDEVSLEGLITSRTRAVVVMHYGGISCQMSYIKKLCKAYGLVLIEDAAHALGAYYRDRAGNLHALGGLGDLSAFSFHQTKIVTCGEGGMLCVNNEFYRERAEYMLEKGTNKIAFERGEVPYYEWVDVGSSFVMSELQAAVLWAQVQKLHDIIAKRQSIWKAYMELLSPLKAEGFLQLPKVPDYAVPNGSIFYILLNNRQERETLCAFLRAKGIETAFHYLPLHLSKFYALKHDGRILPNTQKYSDCLLRLPIHTELTEDDISYICQAINEYFSSQA